MNCWFYLKITFGQSKNNNITLIQQYKKTQRCRQLFNTTTGHSNIKYTSYVWLENLNNNTTGYGKSN